MAEILSFDRLVENVGNVHNITSGAAKGAVNQLLTIRNWAIGYYIVEFEQNGADRAEYGSQLLKKLEERVNTKGMNRMLFYKCRVFYQKYPQIFSIVSKRLRSLEKANHEVPLLPNEVIDTEAILADFSTRRSDSEEPLNEDIEVFLKGIPREPVRHDTFTGEKMTFFHDPDG